jgi:hypothetical protein
VKAVCRWIGLVLLGAFILSIGIWSSLALWFRYGAGEPGRSLIGIAMIALAVISAASLATRWRFWILPTYAGIVLVIFIWWSTIAPSKDRYWAPDVARTVAGRIEGDRLVVDDVRNFTWRSPTDFDQRWDRRRYELSKITDVDLIMSYWAGEAVAHTILSFGFADGSRLAFSVEIRREEGEAFSAIAGFFKQYEMIIIAADERDVVRLRSNTRGEDVRIYRLRMTADSARGLLREYIAEADDLALQPRLYNTLTTNCTTLVFQLVSAVHPTLPLDPRILLSGYLPNYAYDIGAVNTDIPFRELYERSRIRINALASEDDPTFSARIRQGVPAAYGR